MAELGTSFMAPLLADQQYQQNQKLMPVELAQKAASTRYTGALADHLETENAADKKVAAFMAQQAASGGGAPGQPQSVSQRLLGLSDLYSQAGQPTKAAQYAQWASSAAAHESTASAAQVRQKFEEFQMNAGMIDKAVKLFGGVKDATSWDEMNAAVEKETGKPSPFANTPYDPKLVDLLKGQATTEFQKQELSLRRAANEARLADIKSAMSHRTTQDGISSERLRISQQRETRLAKGGGKDVGSPSKVEVEAAARLIGPDLEGDEKDTAAFTVAANAKAIRVKNKGMSSDDALRQALLQAKQSGDFVPFVQNRWSKNTPGKFVVPQPIPPKDSDKVVGQHYTDGKTVYEWTGDKKAPWKRVGAGKAQPTVSSGGGNSDPTDDEDDDVE